MRTLACLVLVCFTAMASAANWPAWRGADGLGISDEKEFPTKWTGTENIKWKTALPGSGNSTPIVWGNRVFLTQATEKGAKRAVLCFDSADGKLLWQRETAFAGTEATHNDNPYCSASPVTDGERVVAWLGSAGFVCYDFDGKELWRRDDLGTFSHQWGNASSPVLYNDLVLAYCGPGTNVFLIALEKKTGKTAWKTDLPAAKAKTPQEYFGSWSTPLLREINGVHELVVGLPKELVAFDPANGNELWKCSGLGPLVYTNPIAARGGDTVVCMAGYGGAALAVRAEGKGEKGDITQSNRLWQAKENIPQRVGSGVVVGDYIYILNDPGFAQCIELKTGKEIWREKLGGQSWGSMTYAGGKLYVIDMRGTAYVLEASPTFALIQKNPLGELTRASPAFSDGHIYIRTYQNLYCVGK